MSALGFQAIVDPFLACVILRFTFGTTPADLLEGDTGGFFGGPTLL